MKKIKVLIVDDEPAARDYLENVLKNYEDIEVIAIACSADEALSCITQSLPDLVFLDIQMPVKSGFDLLIFFVLQVIQFARFALLINIVSVLPLHDFRVVFFST